MDPESLGLRTRGPQTVFCPNSACHARGHIGKGNIRVHSHTERRYVCDECNSTFAATKGTVFYRRRLSKDIIVKIITLLAHGCPRQAIVAAFEVDERTVKSLEKSTGNHCQQVHEHLVEQPRDLGQVQGDEIYAKVQGCILWLAMAIQVQTRLWLGGELSTSRSMDLITKLMQRVRRCALCRPLLFCVDGYKAYVGAIQHVFREPIRDGKRGRPRLRPWDGIHIAQVVKQYVRRRVVGVTRRVVQGSQAQIEILIQRTQGTGVINTAYIERLNATFRSRTTPLVRRGRALARQMGTLHNVMYLVGTVYNFCTYHKSLRVPIYLPGGRRRWLRRTPAIAAGITDHLWTVVSGASTALEASKAARASLTCYERTCCSMVYLITVKCGATLGLSESEYNANTLPVPLACEQARGTGTRGSDPSVRGW